MSKRAKDMAERIKSFSDDIIAFVKTVTDDDWKKVCDWEAWSVGATARHLGAGHLAIYQWADMIVKGQELPQLTMDEIHAMSNKDSLEHEGCTKEEVLDLLQDNGAKMAAYVSGLSDDDLDAKGSMPAFGGQVTTEQFIDYVLLQSAAEHFENIKAAVAG